MDNEKLNEMLLGVWDSLTDEQKAKAKACKTTDELIALAAEEGIGLPDELLEAVAGGANHLPVEFDDYFAGLGCPLKKGETNG